MSRLAGTRLRRKSNDSEKDSSAMPKATQRFDSSMSDRTSLSSTVTPLVVMPQTIFGDTPAYPWMRRLRNAINQQAILRCSIHRHLAFFHSLFEVWIVDCFCFHGIYWRVKKLLESLHQEEKVLGVFHRRHRFELNRKVKILPGGPVTVISAKRLALRDAGISVCGASAGCCRA